ncbi:hypothetical protein E2986_10021 [Frieseomelitta varia]|uniref:Arrestin C-terminal-like domain-containing protein n=1 Tax=Frieseomelitta varia TaxID=561572 RepID=A0A833W2H5_9HYME|nr:hypothetical protein E2986_10021 [Frieseomelitta varia]
MSLKAFRLEFNRSTATYIAGEIVSGNIIVDIAKEKQIRGLFVSATGKAYVHWSETDKNKTRSYTNSEKYFQLKCNIITDLQVKLPRGYNQYPFSFQIPYNIPCSFEHRNGYVRYTVNAVIDRPWKFNHECKAAFTVVSILDLNVHREKCLGVNDETRKTFCCFTNGEINLQISIPSSGYVPGQMVNTIVDYVNSTNISITRVCTKLLQKLQFHSSLKTLIENFIITKTSQTGPFPTNGQIMSGLLISPIPPSYLKYCSIIDVDYELIVCIHISGMHRKIMKNYPVLIGTTPLCLPPSAPPLHNVVSNPSSSYTNEFAITPVPTSTSEKSNASYLPAGDQRRSVVPEQPSIEKKMKLATPPSYEECVSGTQDIRDQNESEYVFGANTPFTPRYPVFNNLEPNKI